MLFLVNMQLAWWEAAFLFVIWAVQFAFSAIAPDEGSQGLGHTIHFSITVIYFMWAAWELLQLLIGRRKPLAFIQFAKMWRRHVRA
jgi:hypothetical protein